MDDSGFGNGVRAIAEADERVTHEEMQTELLREILAELVQAREDRHALRGYILDALRKSPLASFMG